jgi:polar amino acid transport system permease protein
MIWDWEYTFEILPALLEALLLTVQVTLLASAGAFCLGIPLVLLRRFPSRLVRAPARLVAEFVRGTPLIVQVFFAFYVLPRYGVSASAFVVGTIALAVHYSVYASEAYRAGIESIARGHWEAARALHLSRVRTWRTVVLPLAIRRSVPPLAGYAIAMYKDTAALFVIGVPILLAAAKTEGTATYRFLEPYTIAGLFYLAVSYVSAVLLRRLERKYG